MIKIGKNLSKFSTYSCQPKNKYELKKIIYTRMYEEGIDCDLNDIDTSLITDMSYLFYYRDFRGDISEWNVSNVEEMPSMFGFSSFNQDIYNWNVSNVTNMKKMFAQSKFNSDISNWNIREDCKTIGMFDNCPIKEEYKPESTR